MILKWDVEMAMRLGHGESASMDPDSVAARCNAELMGWLAREEALDGDPSLNRNQVSFADDFPAWGHFCGPCVEDDCLDCERPELSAR